MATFYNCDIITLYRYLKFFISSSLKLSAVLCILYPPQSRVASYTLTEEQKKYVQRKIKEKEERKKVWIA